MQILRGQHIHVHQLAISPDSRYVVAAGHWGLNVWDLHHPNAKPALHAGTMTAVQFVSDGRLFSVTRTGWLLLDPADGRSISWQGPTNYRAAASVSPCGQFVIECEYASTSVVHRWRLREDGLGLHRELVWSRPQEPLEMMHSGPLIASDAERFAVGVYVLNQEDRPWTIHRTADGEALAKLEGELFYHHYWTQFTPDGGKFLAGAKSDIYEWDARAGGAGRLAVRHPNGRWFRGVAVHPDGTTLAGVTSDGVSLFELASGGLLRTYDWKFGNLRRVAFTPDGTRCAIAESNSRVLLFDVE